MRSKAVWGGLLAVLLLLQVYTIVQRAGREPHIDETEYLHSAWMMEHGERLYFTFFQHHPPFLFGALRLVATDDIPAFFVRARLLAGAFALLALGSFALIVWRIRPEAAVITVAILFASQPLWQTGLMAARVEPFAMAFFWVGAALVLLSKPEQWLAAGIGLGLVAVGGLWSPKWPFSSAVVAAFWFFGTRYRLRGALVAIALFAVGVGVLAVMVPLDAFWFYNIDFNRAFWPVLASSPYVLKRYFKDATLFLYAPVLLRPIAVAVVFVAALVLRRNRLVAFLLFLIVASLAELRFVFPWPALWHHYYLMWAFAGAALAGLLPFVVTTLLERINFRRSEIAGTAVAIVLTVLAAVQILAAAPIGASNASPYWLAQSWLSRRLQPTDTVWMDLGRHPVGARDESYYWFGFEAMAELLRRDARAARYLPPPKPLPFCAALRGDKMRVRFVSVSENMFVPPDQRRCFEQLLAAGAIRRTPFPSIFEFPR